MASTIRTDKIGPADGSADFTLPTADGSAKSALITNGSKVLSFATGTPSASNFLRGDGTWAAAGGGKILQVLQSVKKDTDSTTSAGTSFVDIAGTDQAGSGSVWGVKITPSAATSKILCSYSITVSNSGSATTQLVLVRDSTDLCIADAASSRVRATGIGEAAHNDGLQTSSHSFLDAPSSTSELTYKVTWAAITGHTAYCNRSKTDTDSASFQRAASTITVMEVGA